MPWHQGKQPRLFGGAVVPVGVEEVSCNNSRTWLNRAVWKNIALVGASTKRWLGTNPKQWNIHHVWIFKIILHHSHMWQLLFLIHWFQDYSLLRNSDQETKFAKGYHSRRWPLVLPYSHLQPSPAPMSQGPWASPMAWWWWPHH